MKRSRTRAHRFGARFVAIGEADYPPVFRHMALPPPLIAVKGNISSSRLTAIGIVGARNASLAGIKMARMLAGIWERRAYSIVSGLARGIDAAAHTGSIDTAGGHDGRAGSDAPYPRKISGLGPRRSAKRGAPRSEMPFGWEPRRATFRAATGLVAGWGSGCGGGSGQSPRSLISARLAAEMGRIVFAVPGSPARPARGRLQPAAQGWRGDRDRGAGYRCPHATHRQRGRTQIAATFEEPPDLSAEPPAGDDERARVLEALGPTPVSIDEIVRHTELSPAQVHLILLESISRDPGAPVRRASLAAAARRLRSARCGPGRRPRDAPCRSDRPACRARPFRPLLQFGQACPHIIPRFCAMAFIDCVPHARLPDQTLPPQDCTTVYTTFK